MPVDLSVNMHFKFTDPCGISGPAKRYKYQEFLTTEKNVGIVHAVESDLTCTPAFVVD